MKRTFVIDMPPTGFETITVANVAIGANAANVANAKAMFITIETANIRYRIDGSNPSNTVGHLVAAGENMFFSAPNANGAALAQFKMIREGANNATAQVTFY